MKSLISMECALSLNHYNKHAVRSALNDALEIVVSGGGIVRLTLFVLCFPLVAACASTQLAAPVENRADGSQPETVSSSVSETSTNAQRKRWHIVQKGETLHGIARDNGVNYHELLALNKVENPGVISPGQRLQLPADTLASGTDRAKPLPLAENIAVTSYPLAPANATNHATATSTTIKTGPLGGKLPYNAHNLALIKQEQGALQAAARSAGMAGTVNGSLVQGPTPQNAGATMLGWPVYGRLLGRFGENGSNGLQIAGKRGSPVRAAADGKVVFSGMSREFGKLLVVKHSNQLLTAYGHNEKLLVEEGMYVKRGQQISEIGSSGTSRVRLHFEARIQGKPIDPIPFLPPLPSMTVQ